MTDLFLSHPPKVKEAAPQATLSEDPAVWAQELLNALLEKAPYMNNYQVDPVIRGNSGEMAYGYGYFLAYPRPAPILGPSEQGPNIPQKPKLHIRIPFVVKKQKLLPIHVFIDMATGKMYPLSQRRVHASLFAPANFSVSGVEAPLSLGQFGDENQLMMPEELPITKTATLCALVGKTISSTVKEKIAHYVANTPELMYGLEKNAAFRTHLMDFLHAESKTGEQIKEAVADALPVDAFLLEKTGEGYLLHSACAYAYTPKSTPISWEEQTTIPEHLRKEAETTGFAVRARTLPIATEEEQPELLEKAGAYKVQTLGGNKDAFFFSQVDNLDGTSTDQSLVKTASGYAYTDKAFGSSVTEVSEDLKLRPWEDLPRGKGFFMKTAEIATTPVTISFYEHSSDGTYAHYSSAFEAGKMKLSTAIPKTPGIIKLGAGSYMVHPETLTRFIPLGVEEKLLTDPEVTTKVANAPLAKQRITIRHLGGEYSLTGLPLEKLGQDTEWLPEGRTLYYLGLTGVNPTLGKAKLAEARTLGKTDTFGYRTLCSYKEQYAMSKEAAKAALAIMPEQDMSLAKIAVVLPDDKSVDAILGLNFVTPENVGVFVEYLPELEEALTKLCELLVAVQLGMSDIPQSAVSRAVDSLETVTAGLELIRLKNKEQEAIL